MIVIDDVIVSREVIEQQFICDLDACKGACCVGGDMGAPLETEELEILENILPAVWPYMTESGKDCVSKQGVYVETPDSEYAHHATPCQKDGPCAFVNYDEKGVALCAIQQAHNEGKVDWAKPISCQLYPIRVKEYPTFTALNYDRWKICDPACDLGKTHQTPLYEFLKDGLVRKFGLEFYERLKGAADFTAGQSNEKHPKE